MNQLKAVATKPIGDSERNDKSTIRQRLRRQGRITSGEWEGDFYEKSNHVPDLSAELEAVNLVAPKVPNQKLHLEKWQAAAAKAGATWKMANTLAKALAQRTSKRWQFVDFLGPKGRESAGVVDILAIRKASSVPDGPLLKRYDLFDIYLIQVKGGSARMPSMAEMLRLRDVQNEYNAKGIILFQWQTNVKSGFYLLNLENFVWEQKSTASLFGT